MNHLDENEIRRFIHNLAPIPEQIKINRHLANCLECAEKVKGRNYLREYPDEVMNSVNIDDLEALQQEEFIRKAVENELRETPDVSFKAMAQQFLGALRRQPGLIFQAFQNSAAKLTLITDLKASAGYTFVRIPFDYARGLIPTRAGDLEENETFKKLSAEANQNLISGDIPGVEAALQQIIVLDPDVYRSFRMNIIKDYRPIGFIESDSIERRIGVYLYAKDLEAAPHGLVALIPRQKDEKPLFKPLVLSRVEEKDYYVAVFEDLPGLMYNVIISDSLE